MTIAENVADVLNRIALACARAGRDPSGVTLVAVSKTFPVEAVLEAYSAGLRHFGENRVEEAQEKIPAVSAQIGAPGDAIVWRLVGHLQSRKAREAVALFAEIQSVDSLKLAQKLDRLCVEAGRVLPVLLECNVSGEETKYGLAASTPEQRAACLLQVEAMLRLPGLRVEGLMTVAPIVARPEDARPVFAALRELRDDWSARLGLPLPRLSMGMTDDFQVAIEEGATLVRIGRALFGERPCALR